MKYSGEENNGNFFRNDEEKKKYRNGINKALRIYNKEVSGACSEISNEFGINGGRGSGKGSQVSIPGHGSEESRKIMEIIVEDLNSLGPMVKSSKEVLMSGSNEECKINALKKLIYNIGSRFDEKPELSGLFFRCGDALKKYVEAIPFQDPPEYKQSGDLGLDDPESPWVYPGENL